MSNTQIIMTGISSVAVIADRTAYNVRYTGKLLVRERSALADPYCHSAWMSVGLCVCVSATLTSNISETKGASG